MQKKYFCLDTPQSLIKRNYESILQNCPSVRKGVKCFHNEIGTMVRLSEWGHMVL